jgi:thiamine biosynthesis lipoprotein
MQKILIALVLLVSAVAQSQIAHKRKLFLLGSPFELTVVAQDTLKGNLFIDEGIAEVKRIENLISDWIPTTLISEINRNAGIRPIKVTTELYDLVERSIKISELTSGAFDISYASMDRIWKFDGSMKSMPTEEAIKNSGAI